MANIRPRGSNSFLLTVEAGYDSKGKRIRKYKTIRVEDKALLKTKKKLNDYLESEYHKFKTEVESGAYIAPEKMLFKDFTNEWIEKHANEHLAETTLSTRLSHLNNHILPALGNKRLDEIKPIHIIDFLNNLTRKNEPNRPISSRTKQDVYITLSSVFERAVRWKVIQENPIRFVEKPKNPKDNKVVNVYDEEEVISLFVAAEKEPFHWRIFLTLTLAAGLRRSECLGLEWDKIDFENRTMEISTAITRGTKTVIKEPKTTSSKRVISLPKSVIAELIEYKQYYDSMKEACEDQWIENERQWLFCNIDGTHFYPTTPTTWWRRFTERAGVRHIRLHDLRHTSATLLINQGVHAKIIAERLGHSDIRVTMNTYGHALRKVDQEAADKLDNLFKKNN